MSHIPTERCLSIIELLADGAKALPLGEIAERLGLPKSGTHRLLGTLVDLGWAEQDPRTSFYRLTMRLAILGQQFYAATGIPDICQPRLDQLARDSGEFVRLAVIDGASLVWVADSQGAAGGLIYQPGLSTNRVPLHATASGKAWLARLALDEVIETCVSDLGCDRPEKLGPNAARTIDELLPMLEETRLRGYGIAMSEAEPGVAAIAAAIVPSDSGEVAGTVSVAGPTIRMTAERIAQLGPLVMAAARDLSNLWPLRRDTRPRPARLHDAA